MDSPTIKCVAMTTLPLPVDHTSSPCRDELAFRGTQTASPPAIYSRWRLHSRDCHGNGCDKHLVAWAANLANDLSLHLLRSHATHRIKSCRIPSEEPRAPVRALDYSLVSGILTIDSQGAEGGERSQDPFRCREGIVGLVPSTQVCSGRGQRTRQTLRSKVVQSRSRPQFMVS